MPGETATMTAAAKAIAGTALVGRPSSLAAKNSPAMIAARTTGASAPTNTV